MPGWSIGVAKIRSAAMLYGPPWGAVQHSSVIYAWLLFSLILFIISPLRPTHLLPTRRDGVLVVRKLGVLLCWAAPRRVLSNTAALYI